MKTKRRFLSVLLGLVLMLIAGLGTANSAYAASTIVFTHSGGYELELSDVIAQDEHGNPVFNNPPQAVSGDYIEIDGTKYDWTVNNDFGDTYPLELAWPMTEWVGNASDVVAGGTCYFRYSFNDADSGQHAAYSSNVEVKIKGNQPAATLAYAPKTTGRTMDRANAKTTTAAMLTTYFTEVGDKVTVTVGNVSTEYTYDGNLFSTAANDGELADVATDFGLEWGDGENFEGSTANYHFWATIKGTKVVSDDIKVTLTGEAAKEVKSIRFIPAEKYQMVVGKTTNPPDQKDGDRIIVAYDDYSTDVFTFDMHGTQGADFYAENGKVLSSVLTDDWKTEWKPNQSFNVGDTPEFVYVAGNLTSNAVKVTIVDVPAPITITEMSFTHSGQYVMVEAAHPSVPAAESGDALEVKYSDGTTESFVYNKTHGAFISSTANCDIESKGGTLSVAWKENQEFKPDTTCYFTYALTDGNNTIKTQDIPVKFVAKEPAKVTKAPTAKNLFYTGSAQELVTAGEADGGTMQYALGNATEATDPYTTTIPQKTEAGTYYVWYKAVGDTDHRDGEASSVQARILAPISATVTFKVVNGKWDDDTAEAKTVTLTGYEGDTLKLAEKDIPAVGNKPAKNYKAGSWDVKPDTETAITKDTTYTYTYAQETAISAKVTFKVVNGSWDDGTTEAKTVTLTGYEGDTLKLAEKDIPAVGNKPAKNYKAGSWDVKPDTETAITKDTTYTYTYAQETTISAKVTFKVVNGSWNDGTTEDVTVTLTGNAGDKLKLAEKDIPAAGKKPAKDYKAGSWDVTPDTETAITGDTTYTYKYAEKTEATVKEAPTAIKPTYNGKAQELVTAGVAEGGTMVYAVTQDDKAPEASAYTKSIPKGTNARVYYVWYKVVGDKDHFDSKPAKVRAKVRRLNINDLRITIKDLTYTGKRQRPDVTIVHGKKTLVRKTDYLLFFNLKNATPGKYEVTAKGRGNYTGAKTLKYKVLLSDIAIKELVGDRHSITVVWSEKDKMTGYQIQYSKNNDMSGEKTVTFKSTEINSDGSKTVTGLSSGTRYYVRMRGYKFINKKKCFTSWSAVESVKTKSKSRRNEAARQVGMNVGETLDLKAMLAEGEAAADWITNEKDIIAVTGDGFVTAMQAGKAAVTAILANGEEIEFAINVSENGIVLLDIGENDLALDLDGDVLGDVLGDVETNMEMEIEN